jgi:NAD(P)-dependent dehydrogenase (short-subunit alcohol dehydrogenase family)
VVTGAGRGLGRAYALLLGRLGASVVVNNRTLEKAEEVVNELKSMGAKAVVDNHNVATEGEKVVETALSAFGRIDIIMYARSVNCICPLLISFFSVTMPASFAIAASKRCHWKSGQT